MTHTTHRRYYGARTVTNTDAPATAAQRRELVRRDALLPRDVARTTYETVTGAGYFSRTAPNRFKLTRGIAADLIDAYKRAA